MKIKNTSVVLVVICCICFGSIAITVRVQRAVSQTAKHDLIQLADSMPLETTKSEALNEFQTVTPKPRKLTDNIYGAREQPVTDPDTGYFFIFCSDKLAGVEAISITKDKKLADEIFSTMKSKLNRFFESNGGIAKCLTTSACQYEIPYLNYGARLYNVYESGVYTILYIKRAENLVSSPNCKQGMTEEVPKALANLFLKGNP